ncbi:MAG: hypothetical protein Ct9H90mP11_01090 [Acidimicrobiales bacterium]|nr:MAG: hypothetical protein Ct9H90mP11_01090 [Acidimicrobiales bacterium]
MSLNREQKRALKKRGELGEDGTPLLRAGNLQGSLSRRRELDSVATSLKSGLS